MNWSFPRQILTTLAISVGASAYPLAHNASREVLTAVIAGAMLSTLNIAAGYAAINYAFNKSMKTFTKVVIGGMGIRLLLLLAAMLFLIAVVRLHVLALSVSMLTFYAIYLALEILFIQKKILLKTSDDTTSRT